MQAVATATLRQVLPREVRADRNALDQCVQDVASLIATKWYANAPLTLSERAVSFRDLRFGSEFEPFFYRVIANAARDVARRIGARRRHEVTAGTMQALGHEPERRDDDDERIPRAARTPDEPAYGVSAESAEYEVLSSHQQRVARDVAERLEDTIREQLVPSIDELARRGDADARSWLTAKTKRAVLDTLIRRDDLLATLLFEGRDPYAPDGEARDLAATLQLHPRRVMTVRAECLKFLRNRFRSDFAAVRRTVRSFLIDGQLP